MVNMITFIKLYYFVKQQFLYRNTDFELIFIFWMNYSAKCTNQLKQYDAFKAVLLWSEESGQCPPILYQFFLCAV